MMTQQSNHLNAFFSTYCFFKDHLTTFIIYLFSTGILSIVSGVVTILWIILVAVMFWKLVFPSYAYQYRNIEKWIHGLAIVLGKQTHTWSKGTSTIAFKIVCLVGQ